MMGPPLRVIIADDHPMFRYGLAAALASATELEVVAVAADGAELINLVGRHRPDVVLTDLAMPGIDGQTATHEILAAHPRTAVLILTMSHQDELILGAVQAGARGYLLKGADREEIVRAVFTVASGATVYGAEIGERVATLLATPRPSTGSAVRPEPFSGLTTREYEVLEHVAAGRGNHEIARTLHLSEKTVRNHVANILAKLHLRDRAAAVAAARDQNIGSCPPGSPDPRHQPGSC